MEMTRRQIRLEDKCVKCGTYLLVRNVRNLCSSCMRDEDSAKKIVPARGVRIR